MDPGIDTDKLLLDSKKFLFQRIVKLDTKHSVDKDSLNHVHRFVANTITKHLSQEISDHSDIVPCRKHKHTAFTDFDIIQQIILYCLSLLSQKR